jgi:hypothetical protein
VIKSTLKWQLTYTVLLVVYIEHYKSKIVIHTWGHCIFNVWVKLHMESKDNSERDEGKEGHKGDGSESKGSEQSKPKVDADYLISELEKFFYEDTELAKSFEDYVKEKSAIIDLDSEEYGLTYTDAHNEYKDMFESRMERQIEKLGATPTDFYLALQEKTEQDKEGHVAFFAQIMLAVTEFDIFMTMMREAARSQVHSKRK